MIFPNHFRSISFAFLIVSLIAAGCNRPDDEIIGETTKRKTPEKIKAKTRINRKGKLEIDTDGGVNVDPVLDGFKEQITQLQKGPASADDGVNRFRISIDAERVAANGIRKIEGKYLDLYTDLPSSPEIKELVEVFDLAVPQWCNYFDVDIAKLEGWHLNGFFMKDAKKFINGGLIPKNLPRFLHGYQLGFQFWVFHKESDYFNRHEVLHEGTHAFMKLIMGGSGPAWYTEGMAELLACHQWKDKNLKMVYRIKNNVEAKLWGRVRVIKEGAKEEMTYSLKEVFNLETSAFLRTDPYAWSWAATAFFDGHPKYKSSFDTLQKNVNNELFTFNNTLLKKYSSEWGQIQEQWKLIVNEMEYGYDVEKCAIEYLETKELETSHSVDVRADKGWQSTAIRVTKGTNYLISSTGKFQIAKHNKVWNSEGNGITIEYFRGRPLGQLMGAIRDETKPFEFGETTPLLRPFTVGSQLELKAKSTGTLFLRINESPSKMDDNGGSLSVTIEKKS